ncbi:PAAR domain-containing protein [Achromobacter ruhlandii]|uniref:PAAR domain-containing protein n=2 Tax=Achromobacter ruhlandii TaxID=72557 RepID=A0ABM8M4Y2_9BURK|nr:PAAR domain-containing protein [Achromobacter ruhlandii]AOU93265.1 proline-alanine-alanine-arginine (PAAR) domain-containing protein [Achromobacter ruhlandii]MCZ8435134.1 PAAR domain-containing protein [Achromobacter ruhlandii]MDC6090941.1 PAAR domain-containing protein [Achromobacter ruhlandii]MDC6148566.1 PAAR domain-containing protein [Achromobacter ruhlandii]WIW00496.1 PAAR domain-containing protein [Achromobacter ruhlandii]
MAQRSVIRKGDRTSHGGVVVTGDESVQIFGQPMARVGDRVTCPKCAGQHTIVEGVQSVSSDRRTALEGMKTSCGATLIASQQFYQLEHGGGDGGGAGVNDAPQALQAGAPAALAAIEPIAAQDAPVKCAQVQDTLKLTEAMFDAKRAPVKLTGPSAYQPPANLARQGDDKLVMYEAWPVGQRVPVVLEPRKPLWTGDLLKSTPHEITERLTEEPQPQPEQVAKSLGVAPKALLQGRDLQITLAKGMSLEDSVKRLDAQVVKGPPWADPTREVHTVGETMFSRITLYSMPGDQAVIDHAVLHELAHSYANNARVDMKAWGAAAKSDGNFPSDYAKAGPPEDFAEFVVMAVATQGTPCEHYARSIYPARYRQLDAMNLLDKSPAPKSA